MPVSSEALFLKPPSGGFSELINSDSARWTSMRLRVVSMVANQDEFEGYPNADVTVHLPVKPVNKTQVRISGRWMSFEVNRGLVAVTPPYYTWPLRYINGQDHNVSTILSLSLPVPTLETVAEQLLPRTAGSDLLRPAFLDDKMTTHLAFVVLQSMKDGSSNFYAEASAQWLSAHLLTKRSQMEEWLKKMSKSSLTDLRLLRVLEYIQEHMGQDLSLAVLALEAGMSAFQFSTLFQKQVGLSPSKHVHTLRMRNASRMLSETNKSSAEIALLCGFKTASHFGVAFHKHFGQSPLTFRAANKWDKLGFENSLFPGSGYRSPKLRNTPVSAHVL